MIYVTFLHNAAPCLPTLIPVSDERLEEAGKLIRIEGEGAGTISASWVQFLCHCSSATLAHRCAVVRDRSQHRADEDRRLLRPNLRAKHGQQFIRRAGVFDGR